MRYFEIDSDGIVVNIVLWDGVSEYSPDGLTLVFAEDAPNDVSYGWKLVNGEWVAPPMQEPQHANVLEK